MALQRRHPALQDPNRRQGHAGSRYGDRRDISQSRSRKIVSSAAARRRETTDREPDIDEEPAPLIKEADPEFEKLLDEEDAIEASTREQSETPHFRAND